MAWIFALFVSLGIVDGGPVRADESARREHTPTFAEVACFVECPQHCLWPESPWSGLETP